MKSVVLRSALPGNLDAARVLGAALLMSCGLSAMPSAFAAVSTSTKWTATLPSTPSGSGTWTVSAGVYNAQGVLVRTLLRGAKVSPGTISGSWNGLNDAGLAVPTGAANPYTIKLAHHTIGYAWEGVIGNTSSSFDGSQVHSYMQAVNSIAIAGGNAYLAAGYNEGQPGLSGFALSAPQQALRPFASTDGFVSYAMVAADGDRLFWANTGGMAKSSFVGAFSRSTSLPSAFSSGQSTCLNYLSPGVCYPAQSYSGVIDLQSASTAVEQTAQAPTGIAVQQGASGVLAVAHGGQNVVRLYNKLTGAYVNQISVPMSGGTLNQIAMSSAGDLWVISGATLRRYSNLVSGPGLALTLSSGLSNPLALAADGSGGVWVADGGASQQLKHFDSNGTAAGVIGAAGGYATDPAVTSGKLCFKAAGGERTALATASDGSVWVVDTCNNRLLHFAASASSSDAQVAYLPVVYTSTVDHGNPQCVYANFLQFCNTTDHTAALQPGGAAWPLVKNWLGGLPSGLVDANAHNDGFGGLTVVETLSNTRTYGLMTVNAQQYVVELPASGPLRLIQQLTPVTGATTTVMYENGDLGYALTNTAAATQTVYRAPLTGFNASGNPIWGSAVSQATVPTTSVSPYSRTGVQTGVVGPRFPKTASGRVVFFDQSVCCSLNFHLGAAALNGTSWLWQASPSGPLDGVGAYQTRGIDGTVNYGGTVVVTSGNHIVYGYRGANFTDTKNGKTGYANQFMHFDDNGLFLGQFGEASTQTIRPIGAQLASDPMSLTLVQESAGGPLYVYSSDESGHGGIHRWKLNGASSVSYKTGSVAAGGTVTLN